MRMRTAIGVSTTAHVGLALAAVIAGWLPASEPPEELPVVGVQIISTADLAAEQISDAPPAPEPPTPEAPEAPEAPAEPVELPTSEAPPPRPAPQPETPSAPPTETAPDVATLVEQVPTPDQVTEETPQAPVAPAEAPDEPISSRPSPRPADRIAPTPQVVEAPTIEEAPTPQAPPTPSETETETAEADTEAAPPDSAPVIVTEADTPSAAPETSIRPPGRPSRPVQTAASQSDPEPTEDPAPAAEPEPASTEGTASDAPAEPAEPAAPSQPVQAGPPLTFGEEEGFKLAVQDCWNVDTGAQWSETIVTVAFEMNRDGTPLTNSIRMISDNGGPDASRAFEAARRAILRCSRGGYGLPEEKFAHWKQVEITFDPTQMSLR